MKNVYPRLAVGLLIVVVLLLYPLGVYFLLDRVGVLVLGAVFMFLAIGRFWLAGRAHPRVLLMLIAGAAAFLALLAYTDSATVLKLYPTLINMICLVVFLLTLIYPPSMIERIAILARMEMSPHGVVYTRVVTGIWCGFFMINGSVAGWLAIFAAPESWALYTGLYSYLAMGLLFAGEYLFRGYYQRRVRSQPVAGGAE